MFVFLRGKRCASSAVGSLRDARRLEQLRRRNERAFGIRAINADLPAWGLTVGVAGFVV
jgi:hypothetical protein